MLAVGTPPLGGNQSPPPCRVNAAFHSQARAIQRHALNRNPAVEKSLSHAKGAKEIFRGPSHALEEG